jgi:hypothetical protein
MEIGGQQVEMKVPLFCGSAGNGEVAFPVGEDSYPLSARGYSVLIHLEPA